MALTHGRRLILISSTVIIQGSLMSDQLLTNFISVSCNNFEMCLCLNVLLFVTVVVVPFYVESTVL